MNTAVRLGGFALGLSLLFGAAFGVGAAVSEPDGGGRTPSRSPASAEPTATHQPGTGH